MISSNLLSLLAGLVLVFTTSTGARAFQLAVQPTVTKGRVTSSVINNKSYSALYAWSLPIPNSASFSSTWYTDCNPTARKTIYNDTPMDYTFVALGNDWPSIDVMEINSAARLDANNDNDALAEQQKQRRRPNPLRRATQWANRYIRRRI